MNAPEKKVDEQQYDAETLRLAKLRRAGHGPGLRGFATEDTDPKGVAGELFIARTFGFPIDDIAKIRPEGDGGVDFTFVLAGRLVTMDVKTASKPFYLIYEEHKIERVADILILCGIDLSGAVRFVGWEFGIKLAAAPIKNFGHGPNYSIRAEKLRGFSELDHILSRREK